MVKSWQNGEAFIQLVEAFVNTLNFSLPLFVGLTALLAAPIHDLRAAEPYPPKLPMEIKVLVVQYFPVKGDRIDQTVTGDFGEPLEETRKKTATQTEQVASCLAGGSRYHGYKDKTAKPSLVYKVVDTIEYLEPMPTVAKSGRTLR